MSDEEQGGRKKRDDEGTVADIESEGEGVDVSEKVSVQSDEEQELSRSVSELSVIQVNVKILSQYDSTRCFFVSLLALAPQLTP